MCVLPSSTKDFRVLVSNDATYSATGMTWNKVVDSTLANINGKTCSQIEAQTFKFNRVTGR